MVLADTGYWLALANARDRWHERAVAVGRQLSTRPVNARLVNCAPWSVLNTSGAPPPRASFRAATQNAASSVFDSRHDSTKQAHTCLLRAGKNL